MIDASQRMITTHTHVPGEAREGWGINPAVKRHLELEIKTLQNAPKDEDKLRKLLETKQRQKKEADDIEDTQRLVTEIEMLKVVLFLVCRDKRRRKEEIPSGIERKKEFKLAQSVADDSAGIRFLLFFLVIIFSHCWGSTPPPESPPPPREERKSVALPPPPEGSITDRYSALSAVTLIDTTLFVSAVQLPLAPSGSSSNLMSAVTPGGISAGDVRPIP
jgi:hypothetical protein